MATAPNILALAVDSLRADHLGCYGEARNTTPVLDEFARSGALLENFFCPAIPTHPSFTTFYTGLHPIAHNIVSHGGQTALVDAVPTLPERLLAHGYRTAAVDNMGWSRWPWFNRGYEVYSDPSRRQKMPLMVSCEALNDSAINFMRQSRSDPFFLFVHYWDVHTPYLPPEPYRRRFYRGGDPADPTNESLTHLFKHPLGKVWQETWFSWLGGVTDAAYVDALYAGALNYLDEKVGDVLQALDELQLRENTLVVVFSDHGESLTEHGIFYDHHGLYDCCLRVPLLLRWPANLAAGQHRDDWAQHFDLTTTLLVAAGLEADGGLEGRNLLAAEESGAQKLISVECTWQAKWSLRTPDYKFILAREPDYYGNPPRELYDLQVDENEVNNIAAEESDVCAAMEEELEEWIRQRLGQAGRGQDPVVEQGITLGRRLYSSGH